MVVETVVVPAANALAAAVLINAGVGKLIAPLGLSRALAEAMPTVGHRVAPRWVRLVAVVEVALAVGLVFVAIRVPAAVFIAGMGSAFVVVGVAGMLRGTETSCGCFGSVDSRPLGASNALVGVALILLAPLNVFAQVGPRYIPEVVLLTSLGVLGLCLWLNRHLIVRLLWRPRRARTA